MIGILNFRNLCLFGDFHVTQHRAGIDRAENDVGVVVEHPMNEADRHTGLALRVEHRHVDLLAENAALGVDFLNGEFQTVAVIGTGYGARS
jgi:hypothetical protein